MKLSLKIFAVTTVVIIVSLSLMGIILISGSFDYSVNRAISNGISEYNILLYTLRTGMISIYETQALQDYHIVGISKQIELALPQGSEFAVIDKSNYIIYSSPDAKEKMLFSDIFYITSESPIYYNVKKLEDNGHNSYYLILSSSMDECGRNLVFAKSIDITSIFEENYRMRYRFTILYVIMTLISITVMLILSGYITRPLKRLAKSANSISRGRYNMRTNIDSGDEIGKLSKNFDHMADKIQETINELERNAAQKEAFVANFAHELKTPLTSVIGYADMIYQNENMTNEEIKTCAGYILSEGMRLESLSLKLLELTVLEKQDFMLERMNAVDVINDIADTIKPLMMKKDISFAYTSEQAYISVEIDLFKTLVLNLLDNASKAGSKNIILTGKKCDESYVISIKDDGCGISKEHIERITEPFYMVDKSRSRKQNGAGLGLSIAARICEIHDTKLVYDSEEGKGTTVSVSLNVVEDYYEE